MSPIQEIDQCIITNNRLAIDTKIFAKFNKAFCKNQITMWILQKGYYEFYYLLLIIPYYYHKL